MDKRHSKEGYRVAYCALENRVGTKTTLSASHGLLAPRARARGHGGSAKMSKQQYCESVYQLHLCPNLIKKQNKPNLNN